MNGIRDARGDVADWREARNGPQISRNILARDIREDDRQYATVGARPHPLGDQQLAQRVAAGIYGVRRQEADEQIAAFDRRANPRVERFAGLQVLAIVEDVVALLGERKADRLDAVAILGCVAEEDSHWAAA